MCVCCIFAIYILCIQSVLSAVALLSRIKSNRTIRQRCPVRSNSNDTMSAQRSGKVLESPPSMKNSNVLPRPNNFPPPNRECVCSESAREEVQKRAIERKNARENVSCNWNLLLESEKPTMRKGITLSNLSDWERREKEHGRESELKLAPSSVWTSCCYSQLGLMPTADETS